MGPLPIYDHTSEGTGSGYIYAKSISLNENESTDLLSRVYPPLLGTNDPTRCLEFYYYMENNAITLNVLTNTSLMTRHTIWSRNYEHREFWWKGNANIKLLTDYSVIFEAVVGQNSKDGLIALDDIGLRNKPCSRLTINNFISFRLKTNFNYLILNSKLIWFV